MIIDERLLFNILELKSVYSGFILLSVFSIVPEICDVKALTGIIFGDDFLFLRFQCISDVDSFLASFQIRYSLDFAFLYFILLGFLGCCLNILVFVFIDHIFNSKTGLIFQSNLGTA